MFESVSEQSLNGRHHDGFALAVAPVQVRHDEVRPGKILVGRAHTLGDDTDNPCAFRAPHLILESSAIKHSNFSSANVLTARL